MRYILIVSIFGILTSCVFPVSNGFHPIRQIALKKPAMTHGNLPLGLLVHNGVLYVVYGGRTEKNGVAVYSMSGDYLFSFTRDDFFRLEGAISPYGKDIIIGDTWNCRALIFSNGGETKHIITPFIGPTGYPVVAVGVTNTGILFLQCGDGSIHLFDSSMNKVSVCKELLNCYPIGAIYNTIGEIVVLCQGKENDRFYLMKFKEKNGKLEKLVSREIYVKYTDDHYYLSSDSHDRIYIASRLRGVIHVYSREGDYQSDVACGTGNKSDSGIYGLSVFNDKLFILRENNRVTVVDYPVRSKNSTAGAGGEKGGGDGGGRDDGSDEER